jgi:hypothetical protein
MPTIEARAQLALIVAPSHGPSAGDSEQHFNDIELVRVAYRWVQPRAERFYANVGIGLLFGRASDRARVRAWPQLLTPLLITHLAGRLTIWSVPSTRAFASVSALWLCDHPRDPGLAKIRDGPVD